MDNNQSKKIYIKSLKYAFLMMLFFVISAIIGTLVGKYIDNRFDISPYGYISSIGISYVISIISVLLILKKSNLSK